MPPSTTKFCPVTNAFAGNLLVHNKSRIRSNSSLGASCGWDGCPCLSLCEQGPGSRCLPGCPCFDAGIGTIAASPDPGYSWPASQDAGTADAGDECADEAVHDL